MPTTTALKPSASSATRLGRLFYLGLSGGRTHAVNPDGSNRKTIVGECRNPDGIAVDAERGHIYWANRGVPSLNDGSIERADLDGKNRSMIVPPGATHTPKQIHLDQPSGKLYWSDREGMRVIRVNLDGSPRAASTSAALSAQPPRRRSWRNRALLPAVCQAMTAS